MFGSIYSAYSGLLGFSKGLDVLSNNVANMNSPGFKSSELSFRDLLYQYGYNGGRGQGEASLQVGEGVDTGSTRMKFRQGDLRDTGNALDVAIDGNGFFILRREGKTFYTRSGQFEFDNDGALIETNSKAHVAALRGGQLVDFSLAGLRNSPPRATSSIIFSGNLSRGQPTNTPHTISNVTVFDSLGGSHALTLNFTNNNGGAWTVEVRDENNAVIATGNIRYQGNGSPDTGANTVTFNFTPTGVPTSSITLNFGDPGTFTGSTSFSGGATSDLKVQSQDGFAAGSLVEASFDQDGYLTTKFSNSQTTKHDRMALAWFTDLQRLTQSGGNLFSNDSGQVVLLDNPGRGVMGKLAPKKIELSNVELTEQFTDMVVIQRGYQASSQVISVANEMIQQLFDIHGKR
jgi:flagellar hook protein FlgE